MGNRFFPNYEKYIITSPYGTRTLNGKTSYHNGIDLVAKGNPYGTTDNIIAHTGGTVEECGYSSSAGNFVRIRVSANSVMSYCHFRDKLAWKKGQKIEKGTVLGYMGSTGNSTGPHLHWGINFKGNWIDPTPYLDKDYTEPKTTTQSNSATVALPMICPGNQGTAVKAMQALLNLRGCNCGVADGIYGNNTKYALQSFQRKHGLMADGICGKDTWTALLTK